MADISVNPRAYCKILLHASKYPHCSINGLLLAERPKTKEGKGLKFVDAVPLFHQHISLSPMMEVALTQVDAYCKSHGLVIGGYYHANEHYKDSTPGPLAQRLADKIYDHCNESCLLMVENDKISFECEDKVYKIFTHSDGKWKALNETRDTLHKDGLSLASTCLQTKAYRHLVDFDNHLDDISQDWRNPQINEFLIHST